eukprot:jgi/Picsp_1/4319/NSC_01827-R1_domain-containing protein
MIQLISSCTQHLLDPAVKVAGLQRPVLQFQPQRSTILSKADQKADNITRRTSLVILSTLFTGWKQLGASSSELLLEQYEDVDNGFAISFPSGWLLGKGDIGGTKSRFSNGAGLQQVFAWYPPTEEMVSGKSLAVTVKSAGPDYTSLGSFGTAEQFAENLIAQMDQSYLRKKLGNAGSIITSARLIQSEEKQNKYIIEYEVSKTKEPVRRVWTSVSLGKSSSGVPKFYTATGSCKEEDVEVVGPLLRASVESLSMLGTDV